MDNQNTMMVDGNNFISHYLKQGTPLVAGKIGVTELNLLYCYSQIRRGGDLMPHLRHEVENIAGLYPYNARTVDWFATELLGALHNIDLIPQWSKVLPQFEAHILEQYCKKAYTTPLQHLEPYFFELPWTNKLEGKTVLVVSPFAESIESNYQKFDLIWGDKIKANFTLKVLKYPFAVPLGDTPYKNSLEVYNEYCDKIASETFDVGIFGTGHTSLLFASMCKSLGRTGIHLGGPTQILFGIKGARWRDLEQFQCFFNEHWTNPLPTEKPRLLHLVEEGCYW